MSSIPVWLVHESLLLPRANVTIPVSTEQNVQMRYCFDRFELDTELLLLTVHDAPPVAADARSVQLLGLLIEAWPEHGERRVLLEKLWPTTVVAHWSLARLVSDTRKLFANAGYTDPLIQTLHGRGYRLAPELAQKLGLPASSTPDEKVDTASPRSRRGLCAALFAFVLALPVAATIAWRWSAESDRLTIGEAADVIGRVLWVDDHPENNLEERRFLESQRIAVYAVTSTEDALKLLVMYDGRYDAVISDMGRGEESLAGLKLVEAMRERGDKTPFYMYTIFPSGEQRQLAAGAGGQGVAVTAEELYAFILPLFSETRVTD